jgi:hypothetical protein
MCIIQDLAIDQLMNASEKEEDYLKLPPHTYKNLITQVGPAAATSL